MFKLKRNTIKIIIGKGTNGIVFQIETAPYDVERCRRVYLYIEIKIRDLEN